MKKILTFLLMMLMLCAFLCAAVYAEENKAFKTGDANLDGVVNIKDATLIQKHVAMLAVIDAEAIDLADVDANCAVNVKDATLVQKFVAGIVTEFPAKTPEIETTEPTTEEQSEVPTTEPVTEPPTKPSVDPDGYYNDVIRP